MELEGLMGEMLTHLNISSSCWEEMVHLCLETLGFHRKVKYFLSVKEEEVATETAE